MPEEPAWVDPPSWVDPVVPDDIRELQADVDAYHRELRLARRRRRWQHLTHTRAWRRWSFPVGVLTGALALAAMVLGVLALDGARGALGHTRPAPLAAASAADGSEGGLVPDLTLTTTDAHHLSLRAQRPALIALLPPHCTCKPLLAALAGQAQEVGLTVIAVGAGEPNADLAALSGRLDRSQVVTAYDADGTLARTYSAHGVTALIVASDGVVTDITRDVTTSTRLELPLESALLLPGDARS